MKHSEVIRKIEMWIVDSINKEAITVDKQLPSEQTIIKKFDTTRNVVREALDSLKTKGIIYFVKGIGYFLTPMYLKSVDMYLRKKDYDNFVVHPTRAEVPPAVVKLFNMDPKLLRQSQWVPYVKIYFRGDKAIRYVVNWINKSILFEASLDAFKKMSFHDFFYEFAPEDAKMKVFEVVSAENLSKTDHQLLGIEDENVNITIPTNYRVYFTETFDIMRISIQKDDPKNFIKYVVY